MWTCVVREKVTKIRLSVADLGWKSQFPIWQTLPCEMFQQDSAPAHRARKTIKLLQRETPAFISPDLRPPNSPNLNPVYCKFGEWWKIASTRKEWRTWMSWECNWLRSGPDCNRTWLTMPSTSGADTCMPAFGARGGHFENLLWDCISYLGYGWWSSLKTCWFIVKQGTWFRLLLVFLFFNISQGSVADSDYC